VIFLFVLVPPGKMSSTLYLVVCALMITQTMSMTNLEECTDVTCDKCREDVKLLSTNCCTSCKLTDGADEGTENSTDSSDVDTAEIDETTNNGTNDMKEMEPGRTGRNETDRTNILDNDDEKTNGNTGTLINGTIDGKPKRNSMPRPGNDPKRTGKHVLNLS